jgi:hypothetical protein
VGETDHTIYAHAVMLQPGLAWKGRPAPHSPPLSGSLSSPRPLLSVRAARAEQVACSAGRVATSQGAQARSGGSAALVLGSSLHTDLRSWHLVAGQLVVTVAASSVDFLPG